MITTQRFFVAALLSVLPHRDAALSQPVTPQPVTARGTGACYEGSIGAGPRLRRVVVEREAPGKATVHLYARPARRVVLLPTPAPSKEGEVLSSADSVTSVAFISNSARLTTRLGAEVVHSTLLPVQPINDTSWAGEWTTAIGPGGVIRLIARLSAGPCGLITGLLDSPDQGQRDLPLTAARVAADSVILEAEYMNFRLAFSARGSDERSGTLTQNGVVTELVLRRGERAPALKRPQEPTRPYPYLERNVRFPSRAAGVQLAGTLTLPNTAGPHPVVVLISGSGAQDRDETIAGHRPFLVLSDHLTRRGYAVLRTDDRGVGASTGNVLKSGLHDIAEDVRGAVDHLRTIPEIDRTRIGLLGHSEGGYVAPIVAAADSSIAFVILLAAPSVRGRDVFIAQRSAITRAGGTTSLAVKVDSMMIARIFTVLDTRPRDDSLDTAVGNALAKWRRTLPARERAIADSLLGERTRSQDSASVEFWKSPWFKSIYHHDPATYLRRMRAPLLVILGDRDVQVPAAQSFRVFESLYPGRRRSLLRIHRLPGINHMLQTAQRGTMDEYMQIEETIAPVVLASIDEWLARLPVRLNQ